MAKVIHLQTDKFIIMPVSGKHIYSECGRTFQANYPKDMERITDFATLVTCKQCLKRIKAKDREFAETFDFNN